MKKYLLGFLSILILAASILGTQSKGPKGERSGRSGRDAGPSLWI